MTKSCKVVFSRTSEKPVHQISDPATSCTDRPPLRSRLTLRTLFAMLALSTICFGMSGCCYTLGNGRDCIGEFMSKQAMCLRDHVWARRAFHQHFPRCDRPHARDFEAGFCDGYCSVTNGGNGEAPALPPEKYWSDKYRSQTGAEQQNAWFNGYEAGVVAAQKEGVGNFHEVQVSNEIMAAMEAAKQLKEGDRGIRTVYDPETAPVVSGDMAVEMLAPSVPPVLPQASANPPTNMPLPFESSTKNVPVPVVRPRNP